MLLYNFDCSKSNYNIHSLSIFPRNGIEQHAPGEDFYRWLIAPWILVYMKIRDFLLCASYHSDHNRVSLKWGCKWMLLPDKINNQTSQHVHNRGWRSILNVNVIPCSIAKLLHHQIPKSIHHQDQAGLNDPKIYSLNCCHPKISSPGPHSGMQQPLGDD